MLQALYTHVLVSQEHGVKPSPLEQATWIHTQALLIASCVTWTNS